MSYLHTDRDYISSSETKTSFRVTWQPEKNLPVSDPTVWGPAFWLSLHSGAYKYPVHASPIVISRMKGFILGIPYILPCETCSVHASAFIEKNFVNLDEICSGRRALFGFFVRFHNMVNMRYKKPALSYDEAWSIYDGSASIMRMSYK
jgi:hypothetical protein